jgi:hypothetical protein
LPFVNWDKTAVLSVSQLAEGPRVGLVSTTNAV